VLRDETDTSTHVSHQSTPLAQVTKRARTGPTPPVRESADPTRNAIQTYISRWINGRHQPQKRFAAILIGTRALHGVRREVNELQKDIVSISGGTLAFFVPFFLVACHILTSNFFLLLLSLFLDHLEDIVMG
jgi:hypothetical protein